LALETDADIRKTSIPPWERKTPIPARERKQPWKGERF
jgi:hypothetical protein